MGIAAFFSPVVALVDFIIAFFADGGILDFLKNAINFLVSIPTLFTDLPSVCISLLIFGVFGILIGIVLRVI